MPTAGCPPRTDHRELKHPPRAPTNAGAFIIAIPKERQPNMTDLEKVIEPTGVGYLGDPLRVESTDGYTGVVKVEYRDNGEGLRLRRPRADRITRAEGIHELLEAGHGFAVTTKAKDPDRPVETLRCLYCGGSVFGDREWGCDCESPWLACECNQCLIRDQVESGLFRNVGRPPKVCPSADCKRQLRNQQQRDRRAKEKVLVGT